MTGRRGEQFVREGDAKMWRLEINDTPAELAMNYLEHWDC
jgi:hypothetical protein